MRHGRIGKAALAAIGLAIAAPAAAQMFVSDSYSFIKAVRERDGTKVQEYLDRPNGNFVGARDQETGETPLHIAVKRRDSAYAQVFISRHGDVNARDRQGMTPLADAAQIGWTDGVQLLLGAGAQPDLANDRGETPLILTTQARDLASAQALIAAGADPRVADHVAGMSALDYAKRDGRSEALVKLFESAKPKPKREVAGPRP